MNLNLSLDSMTQIFSKVWKTNTFRQSSITFAGVFLNGILGVIFYFLTARLLGPASYGVFSVSILTLNLIADISDLGTDTAVVRFVGRHFVDEKDKALKFLKFGLKLKLIIWFIVLIVGWLIMPLISDELLRKPELLLPLRFSLIGVGGVLIFSFATHAVQALERFWVWSFLNVSMNFIRVLVVLFLFSFGLINIWTSISTYIIFPFIGFGVALFFLPKFMSVKSDNSISDEFLKYSKWVGAFTIIAAVSSRLDSYLTTRYLSLTEVGIYSVAVNLAGVVPQIVFALATVVAPKLSKFKSDKQALTYLKKVQAFVIVLGIAGILIGSLLSYVVVPLLYGDVYKESIQPLVVLIIAQAIFLISIPVHTAVIYYFAYPRLFVWISTIHFLTILLLGLILIPNYGYMGAAYTVVVGNIVNFVIPGIWVINKFKKK
jgi:O-antigen/teichoic acid export membrane protein